MDVLFPPDGLTLAHVAGYTAASFALTVLVTRPLIGWLKANQFGKAIRVDGPDHAAKAGTPTMGGLGMLFVIVVLGLVVVWQVWQTSLWAETTRDLTEDRGTVRQGAQILAPIIAVLLFAGLGLIDDLAGLARRSGRAEAGVGLTARTMIVLQSIAASGIVFFTFGILWSNPPNETFEVILLVAMVALIVGTVNGVNLSDGLDGLAAGLLAIAFATVGLYGLAIGAWINSMSKEADVMAYGSFMFGISALALIAAAASLAFLLFNRHPAKVFMGNVASMGLGAGLATLALVNGSWVFLPLFGAVFVAEVVSDIIQVVYFKWTGGKRFFRMAPLHHHFEKGGMPETQIVRRFWLAGLLSSLAALGITAIVVAR